MFRRQILLTLLFVLFYKVPAFADRHLGIHHIFSMNLHCALGDWKSRVDRIIVEAAKTNADILGFQEVCYNDDINMRDYIVKGLKAEGYNVRFWQTYDTHQSFVHYQEQLLIVTRHDPEAARVGALPSVPGLRNGFVGVKVEGIWNVVTHLYFANPVVRGIQMRDLSDKFGKEDSVIFGDMNCGPKDDESNNLIKEGWKYAFGGPTHPAENPDRVLDGFWFSKSFAKNNIVKLVRRHFVNDPNPPSDHLGIEVMMLRK